MAASDKVNGINLYRQGNHEARKKSTGEECQDYIKKMILYLLQVDTFIFRNYSRGH